MIKRFKHYKWYLIIILLLTSVSTVIYYNKKINNLQDSLSIANINQEALFAENSELQNKTIQYQFTIKQLQYFNDSINHKLLQVIKDNKIKDSKIKELEYLKTEVSKVDTVIFSDTVFIDNLNIDTTIVHTNYTLDLSLEYPSTIVTKPTFINEQYTIFSHERKTINPPYKCALWRLFQKKHTVVTVDIINTNPYSDIKERRFIEIIK